MFSTIMVAMVQMFCQRASRGRCLGSLVSTAWAARVTEVWKVYPMTHTAYSPTNST